MFALKKVSELLISRCAIYSKEFEIGQPVDENDLPRPNRLNLYVVDSDQATIMYNIRVFVLQI